MSLGSRSRANLFTAVAVGGIALGIGVSGLKDTNPTMLAALLGLACIGEWLEVRIAPSVAFTMRPAFGFVAAWQLGLSGLFIVGLVPLLTIQVISSRSSLNDALRAVGSDAVSLSAGYLTYRAVGGSSEILTSYPVAAAVVAEVASLLAYWQVNIVSQVGRFGRSEGLSLLRSLLYIQRRAGAHIIFFVVVAVVVHNVQQAYGLLRAGLAAVAIVEHYYPWKLLSEQGGILLTSLQMMAEAVDLKDPYTSNHSQRVSQYAVRLARELDLPEDEVDRIRIGGLMHDIGKIGISGQVIRKPGRLTPAEMASMQNHAIVGADIIAPLEILGESAPIVRHHHENWDGTGYPDGLAGEAIPRGSRIIFVADAFDALTTDRPYRRGATPRMAFEEIARHSGTQFDPGAVDGLRRIYDSLA